MKYVQNAKPKQVENLVFPPKKVYIDFETFSELGIEDYGAWAYAEHPSTEVLFMSYAFDDGPVLTWYNGEPFPEIILNAIEHGAVVVAHNFGFEDAVWHHTLKLPPIPADQVIDTMTVALSLAYPAKLELLGPFLGLAEEQQKLKEGKELIRLFCGPQKRGVRATKETHPLHWERFVIYGKQDVKTTRLCLNKMPTINMTHAFWVEVRHDIEMNRRGVSVDLTLAEYMLHAVEARGSEVNNILSYITGGRVTTVNQTARIVRELSRIKLPNLQKETVVEALARKDLEFLERQILELRQEAGLAATKKYAAFLNRTSSDGRLKGFMRLYGARRTGRYNSQGVQLQNLVRPTMKWVEISEWIDFVLAGLQIPTENVMEVASNLIRPTLIAEKKKVFVISDLSQIEARVLPWLAKDEKTLSVFRSGRDIYRDAAARIYNIVYEAVNDSQRFVGKTATLALGYGQWIDGFIRFCAKYGAEMDYENASEIVPAWRNTHPAIVSYWKTVENAFKHVIRNGGKAEVREKILIYRNQKDVVIRLPSGRHLCYPKAFLRDGEIYFHGEVSLESTYGGKLVENITQAVARDVMVGNLPKIQDAGFDVLFTVHDEVITEIDEDVKENPAEELDSLLARQPLWAEGLPLKAEGYISQRYRKEK